MFNVQDFGTQSDGIYKDTESIQKAIDTAASKGGGQVIIPAGVYHCGALFLRDNIKLFFAPGSLLLASQDPDDFPLIDGYYEGISGKTHAACIGGSGLKNVSICGTGTLDGRGAPWWKKALEGTLAHPRPRLLGFIDCEDLTIEGIHLINSPAWTIHPARCRRVRIQNVNIRNPEDSPNTDGINPESCQDVFIQGCHIDVGDDCITIKAGTERDSLPPMACERIVISDCILSHGHGGVVIGSEMSGGVRDVVISNCILNGTDRGIRLKSRRERGGIVEDIRVNNLIMRKVKCPFVMNLYYFFGPGGKDSITIDPNPQAVTDKTPQFRNIHFSNIIARDTTIAAGAFYGLPEMPLENIHFDHIDITMLAGASAEAAAMRSNAETLSCAGFVGSHMKDFCFDHVSVKGVVGDAYRFESAESVYIEGERQ